MSTSRRNFIVGMGAVGATASATGARNLRGQSPSDSTSSSLDPAHVLARSNGWTVLPNGVDDHDNLEWALRNAPPNGVVRLIEGTYMIGSPIIVADFNGSLVGAGASRTTLTCTEEFDYELWQNAGGAEEDRPPDFPRVQLESSDTFSAPTLITFYKTPLRDGEDAAGRATRIVVRNLRCRGAMRGTLWTFGDEVLSINISNSIDWNNPGARPATTRQDVLISGVEVDGYRSEAFGPFENGCACITVLGGLVLTSNYDLSGEVDGDALGLANGGLLSVTPAEGNVTFRSCTFRNCRIGPGVFGYRDGTIRFTDITTDGCRSNCVQVADISNMQVLIRDNDLFCESFTLPPAFSGIWEAPRPLAAESGGAPADVPSSLGCIVAIQGLEATVGYPFNLRKSALANDATLRDTFGENVTGPLGSWRPQGATTVPEPSFIRVLNNTCRSSGIPNTYCLHFIDAASPVFGSSTLTGTANLNTCTGSQTCISVEHADGIRVLNNDCASQQVGVELHSAPMTRVAGNTFDFGLATDACEIRELDLGEKLDFVRTSPDAGVCTRWP